MQAVGCGTASRLSEPVAVKFPGFAVACLLAALSIPTAQPASAADPLVYPAQVVPASPPPDPLAWSAYELRLGALYHGVGFLGPANESGGIDLNGEFLFPRVPFLQDTEWYKFMPRPQVGGSLNFSGKTSYAYVGLAWTWNVTPQFFVEPLTGGAIHNGTLDSPVTDRLSLGCSPLFRIGVSAGYRLNESWTAMATWEHLSNADLCRRNEGLNNIGVKIGYTF